MKNSKQVISYLESFGASTEKDELAIESFLLRRNVSVDVSRILKSGGGKLQGITFEQFTEWFETSLPVKNEVIVMDSSGLTGITPCLCVNEIILGVSLTPEGVLDTSEVKINPSPGTAYREASYEEKVRLQRALNENGLLWNNARSHLLPVEEPADGLFLRVSLLGERIAVGVFREINAKGQVVMYCVKENDRSVRYSLYEPVADRCACQLEPVSAQEREMLARELEKAGKVWNGFAKRIEPLHFRVEKGEIYFYIDDFLTITATAEKNMPKDLKRLRSGNYYRNRCDAEEMLAFIDKRRKKQLVDFVDGKDRKGQFMKKRSKTAG
ncbi:hypothetical protein [Viscerimonas tarda]